MEPSRNGTLEHLKTKKKTKKHSRYRPFLTTPLLHDFLSLEGLQRHLVTRVEH